ncbi:hypothetical protein bb8_p21 [Bordetella phage vB_BbrP_BB8]|uniref:Uncharacterized protein n=1 Tax=Bordetella phage vB_BbrP_BB8 TaxID=2587820 RepID=A0A4Y5TNS7_9CAUD|nr:hypothetical protein bb8_p21 [Bordetella phage vB_BbrP_BB8]
MLYDTIDDLTDEDLTPLQKAKLLWRSGFPIPVDLATTLMAQGYDVSQLESRYSN